MCCPELLHFISEVEDDANDSTQKHKEQGMSCIEKYTKDLTKVSSKMTTNPFRCDQFQRISSPHTLFPEAITEDSSKVFTIGIEQYEQFVYSRFITGLLAFDSPIKKNMLKIPRDISKIGQISLKQK